MLLSVLRGREIRKTEDQETRKAEALALSILTVGLWSSCWLSASMPHTKGSLTYQLEGSLDPVPFSVLLI